MSKAKLANSNFSRDDFLVDSLLLLSGGKSGHMSKYAFTSPINPGNPWANGPALWERFEREVGDNYSYKREQRYIPHFGMDIACILPEGPLSVIEIGPGTVSAVMHKTTPLIKIFNNAAQYEKKDLHVIEYHSFDISGPFADAAARYVSRKHKITATARVGDLTIGHPQIPAKGTPLTLAFGGTLFNAPSMRGIKSSHIMASYLENLAEITGKGGYIIVSQDAGISKRSHKAYEHEACRQACLSIIHRMASDLPVYGLHPHSFGYEAEWNARENLLTMNAVYEDPKPAEIILAGYERTLNTGDRLPLVNAFKLPASQFQSIAQRANLNVEFTFEPQSDTMALHLLRVL